MKKIIAIVFYIIILSSFIFSESIISGFGIFYKTEYYDGLKQIIEAGFSIIEESAYKDTNTDRKIIKIDTFEYDGLPYKNGTFCFDRSIDGNYYFTLSEGDVDTDKIDSDLDYAESFSVFLQSCNQKYNMKTEQYDDVQLIGYEGNNGGYILLAISEKLHLIYSPKDSL